MPLDEVIARLGLVPNHTIVRIIGGCADMSDEDAWGVRQLFTEAFQGFCGALLVGGTRMIHGNNPDHVLFGITEVGPAIRQANPSSFVLGVVPRCTSFSFADATAQLLTVTQEQAFGITRCTTETGFTTIVHPDHDIVIATMGSLTRNENKWFDEVAFCERFITTLVNYGDWQSLLVAYNGGKVTTYEVCIAAQQGRPVLLVSGSGRACDDFERNTEFLAQYPNVQFCDRTAVSMRDSLQRLGVVALRHGVPEGTV